MVKSVLYNYKILLELKSCIIEELMLSYNT